MHERDEDTPKVEARRKSRTNAFAKGLGVDLAFGAGIIVLSSVFGIAFESATFGILFAILGGIFAWAVWKEFQHRVLRRGDKYEL